MTGGEGFWINPVPEDDVEDFAPEQLWVPEIKANFLGVKTKIHSQLDKVSSNPSAVKTAWESEVIKVTSKCLNPTLIGQQQAQLVFGRVQAGKTSNFTGVLSLLMDNGYNLFIVVAGINLNLRDQTFNRLKKDLGAANDPGFEVLVSDPQRAVGAEANSIVSRLNKIETPGGHFGAVFKKRLVYVVLKEVTHLGWINDVLAQINSNYLSAALLSRTPTLIIDDETDQASPDTYEKSDVQVGAIHDQLSLLREKLPTHTYLGYTATPYANLFMTEVNRLKCNLISTLSPGPDYTGPEKLFRPDSDNNFALALDDWDANRDIIPKSLVRAFSTFIIQSAIVNYGPRRTAMTTDPFAQVESVVTPCSMLIHASRTVSEAQQVFDELQTLHQGWLDAITSPPGPNGLRDKAYLDLWADHLAPAVSEFFPDLPADAEFANVIETVMQECRIMQINGPGKAQGFTFPSEEQFEQSPAWVLIGGQLLDRGQTLPTLVNTYMPRPPGGSSRATLVTGQFDTLQQRGRFYGQRGQYVNVLRGWFDEGALATYKKIGELEPFHIQNLIRLEESGLSLSKLSIIFELSGNLQLARANVLPRDVFQLKSAKWLFRQTHFDDAGDSAANRSVLEQALSSHESKEFDLCSEVNASGLATFKISVPSKVAVNLLTDWSFSKQESKTVPVSTQLIQAYAEKGDGLVDLVLMARPHDNPKSASTNSEFRTAYSKECRLPSGVVLTTNKITGLTSSNDSRYISATRPSIQIHFFELKNSLESHDAIGLALAFPNTTRVAGREGTL